MILCFLCLLWRIYFEAERMNGPDSDVAIIGLACRFPGARDADQFWQNLENGLESVAFFSDEELKS